jgi:hypothetical protein
VLLFFVVTCCVLCCVCALLCRLGLRGEDYSVFLTHYLLVPDLLSQATVLERCSFVRAGPADFAQFAWCIAAIAQAVPSSLDVPADRVAALLAYLQEIHAERQAADAKGPPPRPASALPSAKPVTPPPATAASASASGAAPARAVAVPVEYASGGEPDHV